jgi:hypothetical protein
MMIDTMAERYGQLPSTILREASTLDLFICDAAMGYRNLVTDRANPNYVPPTPSEEELLKILGKSKE